MILKISCSFARSSRNAPPRVDVSGFDQGEFAQRVVDDFARRRHRRGEAVRAKLHHGINFVEVPGDARSHRNGALESFGVLGCGQCRPAPSRGGPRKRIEHEHHAALVLAREFADHQLPGARGDFPVHEARAIGGKIFAQRMQFVPAPAEVACHFAAQQRQHFVELIRGLDARIHDHFHVRVDLARFFEEAERKSRADAESVLAIDAAARKRQLHFLARRRSGAECTERKRAA